MELQLRNFSTLDMRAPTNIDCSFLIMMTSISFICYVVNYFVNPELKSIIVPSFKSGMYLVQAASYKTVMLWQSFWNNHLLLIA